MNGIQKMTGKGMWWLFLLLACLLMKPVTAEATLEIIGGTIDGLMLPVVGQTVGDNLKNVKRGAEDTFGIEERVWLDAATGKKLSSTATFQKGKKYTYRLTLTPGENYSFPYVTMTNGATTGIFTGLISTGIFDYDRAYVEVDTGKLVLLFGEKGMTPGLASYEKDGFLIQDGVLKKYTGSATEVVIPDGTIVIGEDAFYTKWTISKVTMPDSVRTIQRYAFMSCGNLQEVVFSPNVVKISHQAFDYTNLASLTLPEGLRIIESRAFGYGTYPSVYIPSSVMSIGVNLQYDYNMNSFAENESLTSIKVSPYNPVYDSREDCNAIIQSETGVLLTGCTGTVIPKGVVAVDVNAFARAQVKKLEAPRGLEIVRKNGFWTCGMESLTLPDTLRIIDENAFSYTSNLKELRIYAKDVEIADSIGLSSSVKIYGVPGGSVEAYAKAHGFTFVSLIPFKDVKQGTWQFNTVAFVYLNKIMNGKTSTTFEPKSDMTRAQFMVILWNMEGKPKTAYNKPYSDVGSGYYAASAIQWAKNNELASGYSDGSFKPGEPVTREQFMVFLYRYAKYKGYDVTIHGKTYTKCADAGQVNKKFVTQIQWGYERGFIASNGLLAPKDNITRVQAAAIIQHFAKYYW